MKTKKYPVPKITGPYVPVYTPSADVYNGVDTESFTRRRTYDEWIPNDFSVLYSGGEWHLVGITHPRPKGFVDAFNYESNVHEAEYQLFHAAAKGRLFGDVFFPGSFEDRKKILYPDERPGEQYEIWAPQLIEINNRIHIIYSPGTMRHAVSDDYINWEILTPLFKCNGPYYRDPYVTLIDGIYYFVYTGGGKIYLRTSRDFSSWTDPEIISEGFFPGCEPESPVLLKRGNVWYLFWSTFDGRNGCYDDRTFVFAADSPYELNGTVPLTMLHAHAPEFVIGEDGSDYILSVYYPENGVSAAKLIWE